MSGYLGVDVGGTKVAFRVKRDGRAMGESELRWPQPGTADDDLTLLIEALRAVQREWGEPIAAVGVAMPATLDGSGRVIAWPSRPGWSGRDLPALFRGVFPGTVVSFADDGDLAAVAEADVAGCADLVYIGVGTGIGGGVVSGGRPWPGPRLLRARPSGGGPNGRARGARAGGAGARKPRRPAGDLVPGRTPARTGSHLRRVPTGVFNRCGLGDEGGR